MKTNDNCLSGISLPERRSGVPMQRCMVLFKRTSTTYCRFYVERWAGMLFLAPQETLLTRLEML